MSHLPRDEVKIVWDAMSGQSWAAAHEAAHDADDVSRLDPAVAADVIAVARRFDRQKAAFPASFEQFFQILDENAEQLRHL